VLALAWIGCGPPGGGVDAQVDLAPPRPPCALFEAPVQISVDPWQGLVSTQDLDRDGRADIVAVPECSSSVGILPGRSDRAIAERQLAVAGAFYRTPVFADFDGNGTIDFALLDHDDLVEVLVQQPDGSFEETASGPFSQRAAQIGTGDLNDDGHPDLVVGVGGCLFECTGGAAISLLGDGAGLFPTKVLAATVLVDALVLDDFDGDGVTDLLAADFSSFPGAVNLLRGDGTGKFGPPAQLLGVPGGSLGLGVLASGDWNSDGHRDFVVGEGQTIATYLNRGDGSFARSFAIDTVVWSLAVADFNGDGVSDFALNTDGPAVGVLLGAGDGSFQPLDPSCPAGFFARSLAAGDFDGDGAIDLVATNGDGLLAVLFNKNLPR
jgi:hypothetical protein